MLIYVKATTILALEVFFFLYKTHPSETQKRFGDAKQTLPTSQSTFYLGNFAKQVLGKILEVKS